MPTEDPRIDAYIAKSADFAQPILTHLRGVVHAACPDVVETVKWGMPSFTYGGKILAHMAAFKAHCAFGFWQGAAVTGEREGASAMGQFGRIEKVKDLPSKAELTKMVKKAAALIDSGEKVERKPKAAPKPPPEAPADLLAALRKNAAARKTYEGFPPGAQREYVGWIADAKREETRAKRIEQAVEWLAEGKKRNWKYESC
ncbi:YdeI/OmpD-associated family protein [Ramlibacter albus]|uniref:YdeI/OmpD-associated family protein n=1 Tax=Ramlibacter albus TaxID=2079448 RepID=A0A923S3A9_9BURK|nr:YdeI/OmpD-associated family protein [Ramlibacter albus]MBC5766354.1 YdeI/OmpD-associated family protein [Ramlibacter albus]